MNFVFQRDSYAKPQNSLRVIVLAFQTAVVIHAAEFGTGRLRSAHTVHLCSRAPRNTQPVFRYMALADWPL
jgi:hypothetical protein